MTHLEATVDFIKDVIKNKNKNPGVQARITFCREEDGKCATR
jgi:hypothetical protein